MNTLAAGATPQSKYGRLGGYVGPMIAPPAKAIAFFFGLPGEGKSALLQSVPDSFLFNLDGSSTVTPKPNAVIWPGIDPTTGTQLGDEGKPVVLTQELIQGKVALLKDLAKANEPRPHTVIFDSVSTWTRILIDYVTRNAVSLALRSAADGPASSFRQLHGPSAWDSVYETLVQTVAELHNHGYGVFLAGHLVKTRVPIGEDRMASELEFTSAPGFWKRIFPLLEYSVAITASIGEEVTSITEPVTLRGVTKMETRRVAVPVRRVHAITERADLAGMSKARVRLDPILLPLVNGWDTFSSAYLAASTKS